MCGCRGAEVACCSVAATMTAMLAVAGAGNAAARPASFDGHRASFEPLHFHRSSTPVPLQGLRLRGESKLRLLVANLPPFVLNVDTGRVTPVAGGPAARRGVLWVVGVAGRDAVIVAQSGPETKMYGVRSRGAQVSYLGTGSDALPASDGRSVWVRSFVARSHCTLRQIGLSGREVRAPRRFPCGWKIDAGGSLGLVVRRTVVVDPRTGRTVLRTHWGVLAAVGKDLLLAGPGKAFTLLNAETLTKRRLPWPSSLNELDQPAVDPRGRFVALAFADPAWKGGGLQALDVWLLDTQTDKLMQLPGMPAFVSLKFTSMAWTRDDRLVLLGESRGKDMVASWRPGQRHLAVKAVRLPKRISGSDSFAVLG